MSGPGRSGGDDGAATPAADSPLDAEADPALPAGSERPLISVGPPSGSALPHWTEPPTAPTPVAEPVPADDDAAPASAPPTGGTETGAVPDRAPVKPIPANGAHRDDPAALGTPTPVTTTPAVAGNGAVDRAAAPSAPAEAPPAEAGADTDEPVSGEAPAGGGARWRTSGADWLDGDASFADLVADGDTPMGALDESSRMLDEQYLTFEDLDVPQADLPTVPARGSAEDPILIQRTGGVAPVGDAVPAAVVDPDARPAMADGPDGAGSDADALGSGDPDTGAGGGEGGRPEHPGERGTDPESPGNAAPPAPPGRDRGQAIKVGLSIAVATLTIFLVGALTPLRWLPLLLVVAAIIGAMIELFNAAVGAGYRPVNLVGVIAGAALPVTAYFAGSPTIPNGESGIVLVLFLSLVACMAWYLLGAGRGRPVPNIAVTLLGIVYIGVLGSFGALILRAGPWPGTWSGIGDKIDQGIPLIILVIIGTELYDAGGYLLGSRLGRTPLSAASPNKTREGLVLGMACAIAGVVLLGGVLGVGVQDMTQALILALVIAAVAPFGDLFESMLKRDLGVKDMSTLIPSHGGLLDRVDALLFTLPACYYTLRILGLI